MDEKRFEKLADFYVADFLDLSEKMEKTDQKMQFFIQGYITIIVASIALLAKDLVIGGYYHLCACFWLALCIMGFFVLQYSIAAMKIHYDYVNRMNHLRCTVLEHLGKDYAFIQNYGYTAPNKHRKQGMTYWLIHFLKTCISSFWGAFVFFLLFSLGHSNVIGVLTVSVVFVIVTWLLLHKMVMKTTNELIVKGNDLVSKFENKVNDSK